ncbi:MAG: relaxase/mobilization nuclease domain-containing protein [Eubacteriales bacterium]
MAVIESIPEKNQTPSAQKGVLDYCMQPSKTLDEDEQLAYISGYNCVPELANESFLATQKIYGHEPDGVRFYHFVQSFKIGEAISPQEANEIGMELVKSFEKFKNHEAIVATHIDKDHLHNHIVVCAYNLESGRKIHYNKYFLGDLRQKSDEICQAHGLNVLKKYNPNVKSQRLNPKEYRAALNGNSWKMALRVAIDFCMTRAKNKDEFQRKMKKLGYDMVWTPERKYITYICQTADGKEYRVRDIKLNDDKYLKENMEYEFRIRTELYGQAQSEEYAVSNTGRTAEGSTGTDSSDGADQRRGMDAANGNGASNGGSVSGAVGTEGGSVERGEQIHREDDEGGRGAERSGRGSDTEDSTRSDRTGWESERESFRNYRQKNTSGRGNMVSPSRTYVHPNNTDTALMGIRGIANLTDLFEGGEESEEEKRQREARNAGTAVGALVGGAAGAVIALTKQHPTPTDDIDDGEDEGFDITM